MTDTPARRPNILWFCTDQQRYDTIGALGNSHVRTPNLDRFCEKAVAFTHAYCQSPICTPSRASFLTGMYPSSIRASTNGNDYWADAKPLVTKLLADQGYDCGLSGKLHLSACADRIEQRPDDGYRVFNWSHHATDSWPKGHDYADWVRSQGVDLATVGLENIPPQLHQTTWCTDRAIDFMTEDRGDQPWLFSVNTFDPHPPFNPPTSIMETWDVDAMPGPLFRDGDLEAQAKLSNVDFQKPARHPDTFEAKRIQAAYYAMIELIDSNFGRLIEVLERTGQLDNTLVIFTSDHGETLGDHGLLQKGCRFYDGLTRVPLIMSLPERFHQGKQSNALVELRDIAPTLLAAAGVSIPDYMDDRTLLPILEGEADPHHHRDFVRSEFYGTLPPPKFRGSHGTMIRTRRYKLSTYHETDHGELFDLQEDPGEFNNLYHDPAHADVRYRLTKQSFDALAHAVDTGPQQTAAF